MRTNAAVFETEGQYTEAVVNIFTRLNKAGRTLSDQEISFDPVLNQVTGLEQYSAVLRLREPGYRSARLSRGDGA